MASIVLEKYKHRVFPFSFLVGVKIYVGLEKVVSEESLVARKDDISHFFSRFFDSEVPLEDFLGKEGVSFDNGNGMSYVFSKKFIVAELKRSAYKSFMESALIATFPLKWFLFKTLGLGSIPSPILFKRNLFPFDADMEEGNHDFKTIWPIVFSKDFMGTPADEYKNVKGAVMPVEMRVVNDENMQICIASGIGGSKSSSDEFAVVLDIFDTFNGEEKIKEGEVDGKLLELNDRIFDAFNWAVSDEIMSLMEKKS